MTMSTNATSPDADQLLWLRESEIKGPRFSAVADESPRLIVFGAVPLSAAVTVAARAIGWVPYVVDPRERFAKVEDFPGAEQVLTLWPAEAYGRLGGLGPRTGVVALTHARELDDDALKLALRSDAFYVGALGSRRTQDGRRERLLAAGLTEAQLERLAGPAGLDIGGSTIEEAALSIVAEAVAALHGRGGAPLGESVHAIHPDGRP
jgi:xanthine dehydrogenase accessory factor